MNKVIRLEKGVWKIRTGARSARSRFRQLVPADAIMIFQTGVVSQPEYLATMNERTISRYELRRFRGFMPNSKTVILYYEALRLGEEGGKKFPDRASDREHYLDQARRSLGRYSEPGNAGRQRVSPATKQTCFTWNNTVPAANSQPACRQRFEDLVQIIRSIFYPFQVGKLIAAMIINFVIALTFRLSPFEASIAAEFDLESRIARFNSSTENASPLTPIIFEYGLSPLSNAGMPGIASTIAPSRFTQSPIEDVKSPLPDTSSSAD